MSEIFFNNKNKLARAVANLKAAGKDHNDEKLLIAEYEKMGGVYHFGDSHEAPKKKVAKKTAKKTEKKKKKGWLGM